MIESLETFSVIVTDAEKGFKQVKTFFCDSLSSKSGLKTKANKIGLIMIDKGTSKADTLLIWQVNTLLYSAQISSIIWRLQVLSKGELKEGRRQGRLAAGKSILGFFRGGVPTIFLTVLKNSKQST